MNSHLLAYFFAIFGATALFISTLTIQVFGSSESLIGWSIFSSLLSVSIIPGLLGVEQMIYRYSSLQKNDLLILTTIRPYVLASIITSLIVFSVINNMFYHYEGSAIYALPLIGGFGVILSTIYKSMGKFNYAVFISNLWKIGLVCGVVLHILNPWSITCQLFRE